MLEKEKSESKDFSFASVLAWQLDGMNIKKENNISFHQLLDRIGKWKQDNENQSILLLYHFQTEIN